MRTRINKVLSDQIDKNHFLSTSVTRLGEILSLWQNIKYLAVFWRVYLVLGKTFNLLWRFVMLMGKFTLLKMTKY